MERKQDMRQVITFAISLLMMLIGIIGLVTMPDVKMTDVTIDVVGWAAMSIVFLIGGFVVLSSLDKRGF
jgi:hypothetical protein